MPAAALGTFESWVAGGTRSELDGHDVFWRQDGPESGHPVTLLHGFPTSSHDWAALIGPLGEAGFRVTTLDLLGFGASDKPRGHRYRVTEQATLVESLWRHLGVQHTSLVVHDYSVSVAQELLARDTERWRSVTFLNGGLYPELHRPIRVQRLLHGRAGSVLGRLSSERTFRIAMRQITSRPVADADLHAMWQALANNDGKRVQHDLLRYIDERRTERGRWVPALEDFAGPCQFIWGMRDPISGAHVLERLRERMPDRRFDVLEDVGHYPQVEAGDEVAQALLEFLPTVW